MGACRRPSFGVRLGLCQFEFDVSDHVSEGLESWRTLSQPGNLVSQGYRPSAMTNGRRLGTDRLTAELVAGMSG